jgi:hypothetical protein
MRSPKLEAPPWMKFNGTDYWRASVPADEFIIGRTAFIADGQKAALNQTAKLSVPFSIETGRKRQALFYTDR